MPGLLDFLNSDDMRLGIGLLAAGGPTTDPNKTSFGQRLEGAMQGMDARQKQKLQEDYYKSMMMENLSQAQYRQQQNSLLARKLQMEQEFMGYPGSASAPTAPTAGAPADGAPETGSVPALPPPLAARADAMPPIQTPTGPMTAPQIAAKTGIDVNAIRADRLFNDGKKIGEWLKDASGPLPGSSVMVNNIPHIVQPDRSLKPQGGAMDTYQQQKRIDATATAGGRELKVYDPETKRTLYLPASKVLGMEGAGAGAAAPIAATAPLGVRNNNPGNLRPAGASTGFQQFATPEEGISAMDRQLKIYGERDGIDTIAGAVAKWAPPSENNTKAYIERVAKGMNLAPNAKIDLRNPYVRHALGAQIMMHENGPGLFAAGTPPAAAPAAAAAPSTQPASNVAELSARELAAQGREKAYQEAAGKDDAALRKGILNEAFAASGKINRLRQIDMLLKDHDGGKLSQTGLEIASAANSLGISIDKNLGNKEAADALSKALSLQFRDTGEGGGMPGALSDSDREFLIRMTPNLTQSKEGRRKLVQMYVNIEQRKQQIGTFARNYEKKYGQLDHGFYDQLQEWSNANNMFGGK